MSTTSSPFTQAVVTAVRKLYPEKLADSSFDNTGHPIIFRPLKAVTLANSQQNSLLRLAQEGISVYSPHTAVDAAPEGLNDWLADIVTNKPLKKDPSISVESIDHERSIINTVKIYPMDSKVLVGGRISGLSVAVPQSIPKGQKSSVEISSIGICAGSGGSMLNGLDVDLLFTGELSHHEALAAVEQGKCVVTAFHSNTERAFLKDRMQSALTEAMEGKADIAVSEVDRDPFDIIHKDEVNW
ncbi:hypothetical protein DID88_001745 [Monilinia fructigena]|uniref:Uncharacterized protein n=1 Tax=Monilinia fructigena TaxID=38457 RepID=A0A395IXV4_9HELO|nr:hypothetical protein DID88_001745 [Monilinia fructigena]